MSREHAEQFHDQLSQDEELRAQISQASEKVLEIAKGRNLHFTREELASVMKQKLKDSADDPDDGTHPFTAFISERPGQ